MSKLANLHHPTNSGSGKLLPLTSMGTPNTGPVGNVGMKRLPELMNNGKPMTTRCGLLMIDLNGARLKKTNRDQTTNRDHKKS